MHTLAFFLSLRAFSNSSSFNFISSSTSSEADNLSIFNSSYDDDDDDDDDDDGELADLITLPQGQLFQFLL